MSYLFKKEVDALTGFNYTTSLGVGKDCTKLQFDVRYWTLGIQKARHKPNDSNKVVAMSNALRALIRQLSAVAHKNHQLGWE